MMAFREFSKRQGFRERPAEVVHKDAPAALRSFVLRHLSGEMFSNVHVIRKMVSEVLGYVPNPANQSVSQIWGEIESAVRKCQWFLVYDLIEELYRIRNFELSFHGVGFLGDSFRDEVNEFFEQHNIGWQLRTVSVEGTSLSVPEIVIRGGETFETVVSGASAALSGAGMTTAAEEIHQAVADLSRRPDADLTGAVQHGMVALECAGKHICSMTGRQTLDDVVKARPDLFRPPLNEAIQKLWGFASNRGRHLMEGGEPTYAEAELMVGVAATVATYLSRIGDVS